MESVDLGYSLRWYLAARMTHSKAVSGTHHGSRPCMTLTISGKLQLHARGISRQTLMYWPIGISPVLLGRNVTSATLEDDTSQAVSMCNRPLAGILAATNSASILIFLLQKYMQVPRQSSLLHPRCYFTWSRSLSCDRLRRPCFCRQD